MILFSAGKWPKPTTIQLRTGYKSGDASGWGPGERRGMDAAFPIGGRGQPRLSAAAEAPGTHRRFTSARLPAHAPLEWVGCALAFSRRQQGRGAIVSEPLIAHDYPTLLGAAIHGVGLTQVPGPLTTAPISDGRLQALLTPLASRCRGFFCTTRTNIRSLRKLRAFIEHVKYRSTDAPRGATTARRLRKLNRAGSA